MEHGAPLQRRTTLSSCSRSAASVRRAGPMCPAAAHAFSAGHAGPALQGTGRVRADRVVRPYSGSRSRAKRDVVPQGHVFRCAPRQDSVPYICYADTLACLFVGGDAHIAPPCLCGIPSGGQSHPPLRTRPAQQAKKTGGAGLFICSYASMPRLVRYFLTIRATLKVMASSNSRRSRPVSFLIFSSR